MVVRLIALLGLLTLAGTAAAGQLSVYPTTLLLAPTEKAAALTLQNLGGKAEHYQVQVYAWSQSAEGRDLIAPTQDLLVAPSVVEIPAGARRVVRVVRLKGQGSAAYYRLFLRQLPGPRPAGATGMQVLITQDLPLAFQSPSPAPAALSARYSDEGLLLHNDATTAARLTRVGPAGQAAWREGALGWVLPGQTKLVALKPAQRAASVALMVNGQQVIVVAG